MQAAIRATLYGGATRTDELMNDPTNLPLYVPASVFSERTGIPLDFVAHACERGGLASFQDLAGGWHIDVREVVKASINAGIREQHDAIVARTMATALHATMTDANGQAMRQSDYDVHLRELVNRSLASHGCLLPEDRAELQRVRHIAAADRQERE